MNQIIQRKIARINKIRKFLELLKERKEEIDKEKIISWLICEECISKAKAKEEVEAVLIYDGEQTIYEREKKGMEDKKTV